MRLRQLHRQHDEQAQRLAQLGNRHQSLRSEYDRLLARQREQERLHKAQLQLLKDNREQLKLEFEHLANRIFEARGRQFNDNSRATLSDLLQPFRDQITSFQQRIDQVHSESIKGHALLEGELRKVLEVGLQMTSQASNLASALKGDNKTTGNWGEAQLERTLQLAGLVAGSILTFAYTGRLALLEAHARAVRQHLDDLAGKAYANLPGLGSPDFVLMFMPVEPAWLEAMRHNRDLFNYGYQRGVVLVSHSTLMPVLRTVANLWIVERGNREAQEISRSAGDLYNQVCTVAERLQRLGNSLQAAANHYNSTVTSLGGKQGLAGKVERFQQLSTSTSKNMPALEPLHLDIDTDRLGFGSESSADGTGGATPDGA